MESGGAAESGGWDMTAIDLFSGLGGWTEGATRAGARVLWAGNHWPAAVDQHRLNHPATTHVCQDLQQADWSTVPAHDLLLASPACQGHAKARGKERAHHDACRSTAWAVVSAAEFHRPPVVAVENVPEMRNWTLYPAWRFALEALGYAISEQLIDLAGCGGTQNRVRLIVVGVRAKHPLILSNPSASPQSAASVIDFKVGNWSMVHKPGRAADTLVRYAAGLRDHGERFVFSYYGNTLTGRSINRPIGTITTRDRWAVVDGDRMRMVTIPEARKFMSFPAHYLLPENKRVAMHMLGNAIPPLMAAEIVRQIARAV